MNISKKGDVNGEHELKLFTWLKDVCPPPGNIISSSNVVTWKPIKTNDIRWNFVKFLINHQGVPFRRYFYLTPPNHMEHDIVHLMKVCKLRGKTKKREVMSDLGYNW